MAAAASPEGCPVPVIDRPNLLVILIDDLGVRDLGCTGSTFYETPNLDRMAAEGVKFSNAYAASSLCSPARVAIMTGRHPVRVDITNYLAGRGSAGRDLGGCACARREPEPHRLRDRFTDGRAGDGRCVLH
ncbi:MAG: hypothetical protein COZ06_24025 [Armatimonadetes bacterium CG_4_10_14_3_um_filter_66_18]|nr:sulfatase-like hydrolase/transferase [Armatimonadota bacterium]PIU92264.1 MAG: hypothetical protein COS65_18765 [Armatimonadetes bacterium CG06_land_8_20_14_3_00_66_21]PIX38433.1 MAG: hypothetical protein COZ57_30600 [Armatimonadetes bacterium CG_4_8_14_3_um_filter_66_20]PIY42926.1 MAG: hypothetical protein COZ06_24025 [Armatimonadetes bacterium CG_4_10_14_3_um_filter_66_18]PJB60457.1 MAG: hypothetical protein CO096_33870 [Armatimonadetes bacterium CG_4_9_14_3_um_filter_66_14]